VAYTGLTGTTSHTLVCLRTQPRKIMVVSGYRIFSACDRLDVTISHGENKLTPRDSIHHAFVAIYHLEEAQHSRTFVL
jgi:hypothetical protein